VYAVEAAHPRLPARRQRQLCPIEAALPSIPITFILERTRYENGWVIAAGTSAASFHVRRTADPLRPSFRAPVIQDLGKDR